MSKHPSTSQTAPPAIKQIANYACAGYPGLYIVSHEDQRVQGDLLAAVQSIKSNPFKLFVWSCTEGVAGVEKAGGNVTFTPQEGTQDIVDALNWFYGDNKANEHSILVLQGFHLFLNDPNPILFQRIKDCLNIGKRTNRMMIILSCTLTLPPDLEKLFAVLEYKLPGREQLLAVAEGIASSASIKLNGQTEALLDAASGLTTSEAENAFSLSFIEQGDLLPAVVNREKAMVIKKNGLLEVVSHQVTLEDIGGLENLKRDLYSKRNLFTQSAREYGLDTPRGILVVGQPGTGKSLTAQATRTIFNLPLIKLEAGSIFGSLVGESERNWRSAFQTVKAISPCVLWIDEVDGLFSGAESSGKTDGGTTQRVIKAILQDMQFNGDGVFFVFTANEVDNLPDPLIDRLDVWSVDLPNAAERESIWSIHLTKRGRKPSKFNLPLLADQSEGFSGRQIEQVLLRAMTCAFNDKEREVACSDISDCLKQTVPTARLMADQIERRRTRLKNRAQPASLTPIAKTTTADVRRLS
jgi:ATP-dependent 26S proteasome regulatory subunit